MTGRGGPLEIPPHLIPFLPSRLDSVLLLLLWAVDEFPIGVIPNNYRRWLRTTGCLCSEFWRPGVQNGPYRAQIKVSAGLVPSREEFILCLFQPLVASLDCGPITPISASGIPLPSFLLYPNLLRVPLPTDPCDCIGPLTIFPPQES